jgi:hypothetical protein
MKRLLPIEPFGDLIKSSGYNLNLRFGLIHLLRYRQDNSYQLSILVLFYGTYITRIG